MTMFWLSVAAGCLASGLLGFSAVRFGARRLRTDGAPSQAPPKWEHARRAQPPVRQIVFTQAPPLQARPFEAPHYEAPAYEAPPSEAPPSAFVADPQPARELPARAAAGRTRQAAPPKPVPAPTGPRPEAAKLALWARQIKAGERKMSIATDGCRVTWNRTCKHGHPTWLVHLGYLRANHLPRHNPR